MVLTLDLAREAAGAVLSAPASPGRGQGDIDLPRGGTVLAIMDLPPIEESLAAAPRLWIAAAGTAPGWRRAALSSSLDAGASWIALGGTAAPAVIGAAAGALPAAGSARFDTRSAIEIELLHDGMWIEPRDDRALAAGANLALIGDELVQFGRAEPIGANRFRISRLLRGRRGTEWAVGAHVAGERFVLLQAATLIAFDPPVTAIGGDATIMASGIAPADTAEADIAIAGDALRPPSPAFLRAGADGDDLRISWVRRSRIGWAWRDGGDAPLGEEAERYRITIRQGGARLRRSETATPGWTYTAAMQAADGASGAVTIAIEQLGTHGASRPATIDAVI